MHFNAHFVLLISPIVHHWTNW